MVKINLGYWQISAAGDTMRKAWYLVKKTGCNLKTGLKQAWKEIKEFLKDFSTTYKEYKAILYIKNNNRVDKHEIKGQDYEQLMENMLERISEVKGRQFYNNMCNWFLKKYDSALNILEQRRKYTFMDGIWCVM